MMPTVLLVDDEVRSLDAMRRTLEEDFASCSPPAAPTRRACSWSSTRST
jgi:hypothetical protein